MYQADLYAIIDIPKIFPKLSIHGEKEEKGRFNIFKPRWTPAREWIS
jgi:hypothetical protein